MGGKSGPRWVGFWGPGWGGKVAPGGWDFGPQVGRISGPSFSGFSVPCGRDFRVHSHRDHWPNVAFIRCARLGGIGVPGYPGKLVPSGRDVQSQVGRLLCRGWSDRLPRGMFSLLPLCTTLWPWALLVLGPLWGTWREPGLQQEPENDDRSICRTTVGQSGNYRVNTPFRPPSFGRGASGYTKKRRLTARPRCS